MIQYIFELPTAYVENIIISGTRAFHNFSSSTGRYYELILGRDIMIDKMWHKYKLVYVYNTVYKEIVFMTRGPLNLTTLRHAETNEELDMYPIWCKTYNNHVPSGPIAEARLATTRVYVDSINELLVTSDIIPDTCEFYGVQSLSRYIREVLIRTYGDGHGIYMPDIAYGLGNTSPQDVVATLTTVAESGCNPLALDADVYDILMGSTYCSKEDWIGLVGVWFRELDPLSIWFMKKHKASELVMHLASNYNLDILPEVTQRLSAKGYDREPGKLQILTEYASTDYDPSEMDCLIDYVLSFNATDFKFTTVGNTRDGMQDRYYDARIIYKNIETSLVNDKTTYINDNVVQNILNSAYEQPGFITPRHLTMEVEKTWTEELWVRNTNTGEVYYADLVWRLLASSVGLVNKIMTNQLV